MNNRYQLIKPILSDIIHESSSILKGGNKCYKELKKMNKINVSEFEIRNIDTKQIYTFKINKLIGGTSNSDVISRLDRIESKLNDLLTKTKLSNLNKN
jgi:hypothetical protein